MSERLAQKTQALDSIIYFFSSFINTKQPLCFMTYFVQNSYILYVILFLFLRYNFVVLNAVNFFHSSNDFELKNLARTACTIIWFSLIN